MKVVEGLFETLADLLWGNWMLVMLLGLGVFYTLLTGGIQFRALLKLSGIFGKKDNEPDTAVESKGISSMQALCTAIASCVGSGNIVGVATAMIAGGPGALFWMWIAAFFGMATKYGEIVLGICYREQEEDGMYVGGPMYYIAHALRAPWMGTVAALLLFIQNAGATLIQSNTIASVAQEVYQVPQLLTGLVVAAVMSVIIVGGLKRLAFVAQRIVPVMAGLYILGGLVVVLSNLDGLLPVLRLVVQSAFSRQAGLGAVSGITVKEAMRYGVARGLYSNEAGEGTAAVIHSSAQVNHPARQGLYGVVEVFVDTLVICSTTGFAILSSGVDLESTSAVTLAANAFGTVFPAFKYVVSVSLILFASTSIMSQWYFGHVSLTYMKRKRGDRIYRLIFPVLILCGSLSSVGLVWSIQDCMLGLLILPNVAALIILSPQVRRLTKDFFSDN